MGQNSARPGEVKKRLPDGRLVYISTHFDNGDRVVVVRPIREKD